MQEFKNRHTGSEAPCQHLGTLVGNIGCCAQGRQGYMCTALNKICTIQKTPGLDQPDCKGCHHHEPDDEHCIVGDNNGRWQKFTKKPNISLVLDSANPASLIPQVYPFLEKANGELISREFGVDVQVRGQRDRLVVHGGTLTEMVNDARGEVVIVIRGCTTIHANCLELLLQHVSRGQKASFHSVHMGLDGSRAVHNKVDPRKIAEHVPEDLQTQQVVQVDVPMCNVFAFKNLDVQETLCRPGRFEPYATSNWLRAHGLITYAVPGATHYQPEVSFKESPGNLGLSFADCEDSAAIAQFLQQYPEENLKELSDERCEDSN
jgi:hypothetical protein